MKFLTTFILLCYLTSSVCQQDWPYCSSNFPCTPNSESYSVQFNVQTYRWIMNGQTLVEEGPHLGIDLQGFQSSPAENIYSPVSGTVIDVFNDFNLGWKIVIRPNNPNAKYHLIGHLESHPNLFTGNMVNNGQFLGVTKSGFWSDPFCHTDYTIYEDTQQSGIQSYDPLQYYSNFDASAPVIGDYNGDQRTVWFVKQKSFAPDYQLEKNSLHGRIKVYAEIYDDQSFGANQGIIQEPKKISWKLIDSGNNTLFDKYLFDKEHFVYSPHNQPLQGRNFYTADGGEGFETDFYDLNNNLVNYRDLRVASDPMCHANSSSCNTSHYEVMTNFDLTNSIDLSFSNQNTFGNARHWMSNANASITEWDGYDPGNPLTWLAFNSNEAKFNDGAYQIEITAEDYAHSTTHIENVIIDNFKPYLEEIKIYFSDVNQLYKTYRYDFDSSDDKVYFSAISGYNDLPVQIHYQIQSSEPLDVSSIVAEVQLNSTGQSVLNNETIVDLGNNNYLITFSDSYIYSTTDTYQLVINGQDLSGNYLIQMNQLITDPCNSLINFKNNDPKIFAFEQPYYDYSSDSFKDPSLVENPNNLINAFCFKFEDCIDGNFKNQVASANRSSTSCLSADFTYDLYGCEVFFTDLSTGFPTSYYWDFDDGAVSYEQNPSHIYEEPGTYTVLLEVSDGSEPSTYEEIIVIEECSDEDDGDFIDGCVISGPILGVNEQTIVLSAEGIGLPPFNFEWTMNNNNAIINGDNTGSTVSITLDGTNEEVASINLDIYDAFGNYESCTHEIEISGNIPEVEIVLFPNQIGNYLYLLAIYDAWNGIDGDEYIFTVYDNIAEAVYQTPFNMGEDDYDLAFNGTQPGDQMMPLPPGDYTISITMSLSGATDSQDILWQIDAIEPPPPSCTDEPVQLSYTETGTTDWSLDVGESLIMEIDGSFPGLDCQFLDCGSDGLCQYLIIYELYDLTDGGEGVLIGPTGALGNDFDPQAPVEVLNTNQVYNDFPKIFANEQRELEFNSGCDPGLYKIEFYIYVMRCGGFEGIVDLAQNPDYSNPCPIYFEKTYDFPEIASFNVDGTCNQLEAEIQGGCRLNGSSSCGDEHYTNFQWKAYRFDNPDQEILGLLENAVNGHCTQMTSSYNEYYTEFSGDNMAFYLELICEDDNGITAQKKELVTINKPLHFNVPTPIIRCSNNAQFVLDGQVASGGVGNLEFFYENYSEWYNNPNPIFDSSISDNPVKIRVIDESGCEIFLEVSINFEDISITPESQNINVCETSNSAQTLLGTDPMSSITGGSGEFSYEWTSVPPEAIDNLSSTTELNPTVWYDGIADFTLEVTDLLADCSASTTITVNGTSTELIAHTYHIDIIDEITLCNRTEITLGKNINGFPFEIESGIVDPIEILLEWTSTNPLFEDTDELFPHIEHSQHSVAGSYDYMLKAIDPNNGCFDEDAFTIHVRKPFMYTGFAPQDQFVIPGLTQAVAWSSNVVNKIILESEDDRSSGQNPLSYNWIDYTGSETVNGSLDTDFNVDIFPQSAGSHEMQILNGDGCSVEVKTDNFVFLEDLAPSLTIEITNGDGDMMFCDDEEVCFEVMLNLDLYSTPASLPSTLTFDYTISFPNGASNCVDVVTPLTLNLIDGIQGIYTANFCFTSPYADCTGNSFHPTIVNVLVESNELLEINSYIQYMLHSGAPDFHDDCYHLCGPIQAPIGNGIVTQDGIVSRRGSLYFAELASPCHNCNLGFEFPKWGRTLFAQAVHPGKIEFGLGFEGTLGSDMVGILMGGPNGCTQLTSEVIEEQNTIIRHDDNVIEFDNIHIYPNPTDAVFTIRSTEGFDASSRFTLFSAKGEKLKEYSYSDLKDNSRLSIDLSSYNTGMYFVHIQNEDSEKESILKIIKSQP